MNNPNVKIWGIVLTILFAVAGQILSEKPTSRPKLPELLPELCNGLQLCDDLKTIETHSFNQYIDKVSDHIHQVTVFNFKNQTYDVIKTIFIFMSIFGIIYIVAQCQFDKSATNAEAKKSSAELAIFQSIYCIFFLLIVLIVLFFYVFAI